MRMELADHVTDGARGFLRFCTGVQTQFAHRVDDAALYRFQAVAEKGQGAVEHHVHRVIEIGAFGVFAQRDLFEAVESGAGRLGHAIIRMNQAFIVARNTGQRLPGERLFRNTLD